MKVNNIGMEQSKIIDTTETYQTPQRNGVSERHNRTLLDMVRSMMSLTDLSLSFWGYALETAAFTLNRAPSRVNFSSQNHIYSKTNLHQFYPVWTPFNMDILRNKKHATNRNWHWALDQYLVPKII